MCTHLHDTTTRYDRERKVLTFLMVCTECETERVMHALDYEPDFIPTVPPRRHLSLVPTAVADELPLAA
ncbi:MAG: hypothetical protein ACJ76V_06315 [Thermoleophilaceae bacterium]